MHVAAVEEETFSLCTVLARLALCFIYHAALFTLLPCILVLSLGSSSSMHECDVQDGVHNTCGEALYLEAYA